MQRKWFEIRYLTLQVQFLPEYYASFKIARNKSKKYKYMTAQDHTGNGFEIFFIKSMILDHTLR